MFIALRKSAASKLQIAIETVGAVVSMSGAVTAIAFGKALLAVVLGVVAVGIFFRLSSRRKAMDGRSSPVVSRTTSAIAGVLSLLEGAVLVEATDLPVRFSQPGFALHHWALILVFLVIAFAIQRRVLAGLFRRQAVPPVV